MAEKGTNSLNLSILKHLDSLKKSQLCGQDTEESLEVAIQCLQEVFHADLNNPEVAQLIQRQPSLQQLFDQYLGSKDFGKLKDLAEEFKIKGNAELKRGNYKDALHLYSKAIELDESNAVYYCNRALVHIKENNLASALQDSQKAISLNPQYSRAYSRLGQIHWLQGDADRAKELYEKAIELDPDNKEYKRLLSEATSKPQPKEQEVDSAPKSFGEEEGRQPAPGDQGPMNLESLLGNPALLQTATAMMANPEIQSLLGSVFSRMGSGTPEESANLMSNVQAMAEQNPNLAEEINRTYRQHVDSSKDSDDEPKEQ